MISKKVLGVSILLISFLFVGNNHKIYAQEIPLSLDSIISLAIKNNLQIHTANLNIEQAKALKSSEVDLDKTNFTLSQDATSGGGGDNSISISQKIAWPGVYKNQKNVLGKQLSVAEESKNYTQAEVIRDAKKAYYDYLFSFNILKILEFQDSVYRDFIDKSEIRYKVGETSNLERITARNKYQEIQAMKKAEMAELKIRELTLQQILYIKTPIKLVEDNLPILSIDQKIVSENSRNPILNLYGKQVELAEARVGLEKSKFMPDITLGYSHQFVLKSFDPANIGRDYFPGTRIAGFEIGVALPIFNKAGRARLNSEKIASQVAMTNYKSVENEYRVAYQQVFQTYLKNKEIIDYYTHSGLKQADEQMRIAQVSYDLGEIGYIEFIQNMELAVQSKLTYLKTIQQINQLVIQLQFLKGK